MIAKAAPWKHGTISKLSEDISRGGTLAIIDIHGIPADAMLGMRKTLRESMSIRVAKKKLMNRAWNEANLDTKILDEMYGNAVQPALVQTSKYDSFALFSELKKTEAGRAAKPGDVAPKDIVVEKQDTGLAPGPIVGDLNSIGIPAKIMKGSVHIQKDTVAIKEGETFEGDLGMMLSKLGINPIEIGLILTGAIEDGHIFYSSDLDLDTDGLRQDIISATSGAFNLACNVSWFSSITTPTLISKASGEALSAAIEAGIINDETATIIISKAKNSALALAGQLDSSALDEELLAALGAASHSAEVAPSEATESEEAEEAPPVEEEEEEEDAGFGGLGDLFGLKKGE